ncbi:LOW QUALITY PROTEIN: uncharacterized protein LOC119576816 [Penaeus monodon]|uniref:LOW QUALITY PROTEIN: uncharacterized protein LOC119576816 n=1 Tax=Penaeus monodon TaxID=6687 RepID=UPI0018A75CFA|nr:LOW QUALITY PROTEIN: uncharacterized protein LOC119576816 [Penaeus monodon]
MQILGRNPRLGPRAQGAPLSLEAGFFNREGHFPFSSELCLLWISLDVLFCTSSIMHLCTLSVDRFLSLRYPMKFGRHKTRRRVVLKIVLVWCLSLAASLPLSLMYATDPHSTIVDGVCQIPVSLFQIIGSVICFYIPLVIMLVTYALTLRLLSKKQNELHAGLLETSSASPSPRSLRWKKLLCKTTSNLSTSTAVSLADGDISEGGCGALEARCDEGKLRRFGSSPSRRPPLVRYTSHHYRTALHRGGAAGCPRRGYSAREVKDDDAGATLAGERLLPSLPANAVYELSVFSHDSPERPRSAPTSTTTSPRRRRNRSPGGMSQQDEAKENVVSEETSAEIEVQQAADAVSCEQNGDPRRAATKAATAPSTCGETCDAGDNSSSHVAVPCSCAPRFFLEDIKASAGAQCEECAEPRPQDPSSTFRSHQHGRKRSRDSGHGKEGRGGTCCACRRRGAGWCCSLEGPDVGWCCSGVLARIASLRHTGSRADGGGLASPWHEGSPRTHDLVARAANLRSGGQVSTMLRKPSSGESSSITSSPSSGRSLWRQQSCTASIKYMSSKKHGRNIRMEQKATKVLGVVFFTFVLLWAPFFIANVLISCGAHIGEEVINLVTWLGYASSMVNPFFYTFFNKTFRQTFLKIIKCQMKSGRKYHF